jgi:hypothetical protein
LLFANEGQAYHGSFKDNLMHGHGQMVMPDNSKFRGEWKEGNRKRWIVPVSDKS